MSLEDSVLINSRRFQPGEGPSRGILCDCWNQWIVCSSSLKSMLPSTNKLGCWDVDKLRNVSKQYFMPLTAFSALYFLLWTADWIRYKVSVWHNCPQCHAVITLCHRVKHGLMSAWSSIIAWISVNSCSVFSRSEPIMRPVCSKSRRRLWWSWQISC